MASVYSVFYELDGVFDMCRTDFSSVEAAGFWIDRNLLPAKKVRFHFMLKDGYMLIKGEVQDNSPGFFNDCMKFSKSIEPDKAWIVGQG